MNQKGSHSLPGLEVILRLVDLVNRVPDLREGKLHPTLLGGIGSETLNIDLKLNHLPCDSGHLVGEAEGVLALHINVEDKITIPVLHGRVNDGAPWVLHLKINVKVSSRLDLIATRKIGREKVNLVILCKAKEEALSQQTQRRSSSRYPNSGLRGKSRRPRGLARSRRSLRMRGEREKEKEKRKSENQIIFENSRPCKQNSKIKIGIKIT